MELIAGILTGFAVGLRHSLEPDHLAAISTLVDDESDYPSIRGALWGVGHSIPIVLFGVGLLLFGFNPPEGLPGLFELAAGIVLVFLGIRSIMQVRGKLGLSFLHRHSHDGHSHTHIDIGGWKIGGLHSHYRGESILVGVIHGLAGSGGLVVILASTTSSFEIGAGFLAVFSLTTMAVMGTIGYLWSSVLEGREGFSHYLRGAAGFICLAIGGLLTWSSVGLFF